ncbi:MAG: hypothetical protein AB7O68_16850 [Pirellulales bacterium]
MAVYHLPSSGDKTYPGSASATIEGAFLPLDRKNAAYEGVVFGNQYELYVAPTADIRPTDKLVIDGSTYFVKQVFIAPFGGLAHKRASISLEA